MCLNPPFGSPFRAAAVLLLAGIAWLRPAEIPKPESLSAPSGACSPGAVRDPGEVLFPFWIPWDDALPNIAGAARIPDSPAGGEGFVQADGDGHLSTGSGRIRFWGVNFTYESCFPDADTAVDVARHLAKLGVNLVRFHHLDAHAPPYGIWQSTEPDRTLDAGQLDRLDYFIDQLRRQGIYSDLNLLVSRPLHRGSELPPDLDLVTDWKVRHALGFFDPAIQELERRYARDLLTHVNPYTGRAYVDEPAVALVEVANEVGLVSTYLFGGLDTLPPYYDGELRAIWNGWLQARHGTQTALEEAWEVQEAPLGPEMLSNGGFAGASLSPWVLERHGSPVAEATAVAVSEGPSGGRAARIQVTRPGQEGWHVQFQQAGLAVAANALYTLTFWARADSSRTIAAALGQAHDPWGMLGLYGAVPLTTGWQQFSFTFLASATDSAARVLFTGLGLQVGTVWLADVSLRPGGRIGLYPGEDLAAGTVGAFRRADESGRTAAGLRDWYRFLLDTEEQYWSAMRNFLRHDLGARPLLAGTALPFSTPNLMARFDVVDSHAYWQHPVFPGTPWDPVDWYVWNSAMVNHPADATVAALSMARVLGKPHAVSEYNHPHPNTFQAEAFPLLAVYASLQDWDAVMAFDYASHRLDLDARRITGFFEVAQNPVQLATFPLSALAFRRGDLRPAGARVVARLAPEDEPVIAQGAGWPRLDATAAGEDARAGLVHRVALAVHGQDPPAGALEPGATDVSGTILAADTGEVRWDQSIPGRGVLTVNAPRLRLVSGFGHGRSWDLGGVVVIPGPTLQDGFGVIGLAAVDGESAETARRLLVTAAGVQTNTAVAWYRYPDVPVAFPPPEGMQVTWRDGTGLAPSLVEGIPATLRLPLPAGALRVWALDGSGRRAGQVPVREDGDGAAFDLGPQWQALWYEIVHWNTVAGDLDMDGRLSALDLLTLRLLLAGDLEAGTEPFTAPAEAADLCGDGSADSVDLVLLAARLAGL